MIKEDINFLKEKGFSVRKLPNQEEYQVASMRHGDCLFWKNFKKDKLSDFRKEVERNENTIKW